MFFVEPHPDAFAYRLERGQPVVLARAVISRTDEDEVLVHENAGEAFGLHTYRITAIDLAGNESLPVEATMNLGCPGTCASGDPSSLALVLGLFALSLYRRRR